MLDSWALVPYSLHVVPLLPIDNHSSTRLAVSNNGVDLEGEWAELEFKVIHPIKVFSVDPTTVSSIGKTNLFVKGIGFAQTVHFHINATFCKISHDVVAAVILSDHELVCAAPQLPNVTSPFFTTLAVSIDGGYTYTDTVFAPSILIHPPALILSVSLTWEQNMTAPFIQVFGHHFFRSAYISCMLDELAVPAIWKSNSMVLCDVPMYLQVLSQEERM